MRCQANEEKTSLQKLDNQKKTFSAGSLDTGTLQQKHELGKNLVDY